MVIFRNNVRLPEGHSPSEIGIWRGIQASKVEINYEQICFISTNIQCEAPKISKFVYDSNNYGLWYL